jgi:hypothetical protein
MCVCVCVCIHTYIHTYNEICCDAINIVVQVSLLYTDLHNFTGVNQDHMAYLFLVFGGASIFIAIVAALIYIPTHRV